tara:strand:+ start:68402 stop:69487 length:1086 start_codon:yes stop_codon:yes gene_type:complete
MRAPRNTISPILLVLVANSAIAFGQPDSDTDPQPGSPAQVEDALSILPRVGTNQEPVMPTTPEVSVPKQPGLTEGQDWLKVLHETLDEATEPTKLAEGAFVLKRLGQLYEGPSDLLIFVPDKATRSIAESPVLLMPCQALEQLESEWTGQQVEVSGEIFTYHGRNQLLISSYRIGTFIHDSAKPQPDDTAEPKQAPEQDPEREPSTNEPTGLEADPAVRDLLNELNFDAEPTDANPSQANRQAMHDQLTPRHQLGGRQQVTTTSAGLKEGTLIMRRPARMIRNSSGAWTIVFDNDDPEHTDSIELIVEPCRMLMRMESIAMQSGDAGRLLVSGRVYAYKGANYILPTLIQRVRAQEINSLQ